MDSWVMSSVRSSVTLASEGGGGDRRRRGGAAAFAVAKEGEMTVEAKAAEREV